MNKEMDLLETFEWLIWDMEAIGVNAIGVVSDQEGNAIGVWDGVVTVLGSDAGFTIHHFHIFTHDIFSSHGYFIIDHHTTHNYTMDNDTGILPWESKRVSYHHEASLIKLNEILLKLEDKFGISILEKLNQG
jgi:hypothetical protein